MAEKRTIAIRGGWAEPRGKRWVFVGSNSVMSWNCARWTVGRMRQILGVGVSLDKLQTPLLVSG